MKGRRALLALALAVGLGLTLLWILIVQAGTNEWTPTGPPGGPYYTDFPHELNYYRAEILAVAVDPNTAGTVYALAASPGNQGPTKIYKSTNRGENWTVRYTATNQLNALAISGTLVYAGGHDRGSCCGGTGNIFKSIDSGLQWTAVYTPPGWGEIWALAIHPLTPTTVYAAGGEEEVAMGPWMGVVQRTTDGGLNWTDLLTMTDGFLNALVINPITPTTVYASGWDGSQGCIYRSTDGINFSEVYTAADGWVPELTLNPLTPTIIYAGTSAGALNAVLRSTDEGLNWTEVLTEYLTHPYPAVDPPNTVYAMDKNGGTVYSSTVDGDPGTWNQTAGTPEGWYANDLAIELPSYLYAAMGGFDRPGVYRSDNNGDSWSMKNDGLRVPVGPVDIAIDPQTPSILYTTGFEPGGWKSTDSGVTWSFMDGTCYLWCFAIHPMTSTTVLAGGSCDQCSTLYRSTDGGAQWTGVYTSPGVATSYGEVTAMAIHPVTPSIAYAAEWNGDPLDNGRILRSTDGGLSWTAVYTENDLRLNTVAAGSALAGGRAGKDGAIYRSSDGTINWTRVYTANEEITSIVVHPVTPNIVLAADRRGNLYRSTNGGLNWTDTGERPGPELAFNPLDANIVYGSDPGCFQRSTDGGNTWEPFCAGLPAGGSIGAIAVDRGTDAQTIYIGYAGVWSYSQPSPLQVIYLPIIMKNY